MYPLVTRSDGSSRFSHTKTKRSIFHSLTRVGDLRPRAYQLLAQEEILGLSSCARRVSRDRVQLSQNRDHRPLPYHTRARASWRISLSGGTAVNATDWLSI
jgi:hypothetical protein